MKRKVFLAFPGTNNYIACNYYLENSPSRRVKGVKYVQEALLQLYCHDFGQQDVACFFLTQDARRQNWDCDGQWNRSTGMYDLPNIGLSKRMSVLQKKGIFRGAIKDFDIPEGFSSDEIWAIFKVVFSSLKEGDEVILDITHAFRSLPMLGMVLVNYAKALKNIKVKTICYGAFEKLGPAALVAQKPIEERNAPVLDLIAFSELQNWTMAAQEFIHLGKVNSLAALSEDSNPDLARQLLAFEQSIATCRGMLLTQKTDVQRLKNEFTENMNAPIKEQLKPLLARIEEKIAPFDNCDTLNNGFAAVQWCIRHKMIQQGITFLQESIVSHITEKFAGKEKLNDLFYRTITTTALQQFPFEKNQYFEGDFLNNTLEHKKHIQALYTNMLTYVSSKAPLSDLFWKLTGKEGFRNDINHCGFKEDYISANELKISLENLFNQIKQLDL